MFILNWFNLIYTFGAGLKFVFLYFKQSSVQKFKFNEQSSQKKKKEIQFNSWAFDLRILLTNLKDAWCIQSSRKSGSRAHSHVSRVYNIFTRYWFENVNFRRFRVSHSLSSSARRRRSPENIFSRADTRGNSIWGFIIQICWLWIFE